MQKRSVSACTFGTLSARGCDRSNRCERRSHCRTCTSRRCACSRERKSGCCAMSQEGEPNGEEASRTSRAGPAGRRRKGNAFSLQVMRFHQISANFHKNWVRHCNDHRKEEDDDGGDKNDDAGDKNDDGDDDVDQPGRRAELPGSAMLLSTNPAATHSVLLSRRSAAGQRKQRPQPRRRNAAGGTLPGIKGHRLQSGQKAK